MSHYLVQMLQLRHSHPDTDAFLRQGGFSVQRSNNPFSRVASDQAIEQSINRALKTTGGIMGFQPQSWNSTKMGIAGSSVHDRASMTDMSMQHCGLDEGTEGKEMFHKECQATRLQRDEDVLLVIDTVTKFMFCWLLTQ